MGNDRIMGQIRNLLSQGRSSGEVIALGYKPGTVYKVQRQLRLGWADGQEPAPAMDGAKPGSDGEGPEESADDVEEAWRDFFEAMEEPDTSEAMRAELDQGRSRIEELEKEAAQVEALQERVHTLEAEAEAGAALYERIRDLERQLNSADHAQQGMRQSHLELQARFHAEQSARRDAERRAEDHRSRSSEWQRQCKLLQSQLDSSTQVIADLHAEIQRLEPLKVWAGHPCSVCHKPMSGSVARYLASMKMKNVAHKGCLSRQGPGVGEVLLAGDALWGLSQLGKR
jgi:hypothetical protein